METIRISGNISRDAEIRTISQKDYYCFGIACDRGNDKTNFYKVNLRKYGDKDLCQYLKKGAILDVEGDPSYEVYNDKPQVTIWATKYGILRFPKKETDDLPAADEGDAF